MERNLNFPLFHPYLMLRPKANILKNDVSVPAYGDIQIANVEGQSGRLHQVSVNLDSQTVLRLVIALDNKRIVNHTPEDIEDTGAGDLAIEIPNAFGSVLQTTKSAANNYSISFAGHLIQCDFDHKLRVWIHNDSSAAVSFHALYAIWGIYFIKKFKIKE